jgi:hypothetical protein
MESCNAVEKELERVLSKFAYIDKHTANSLQELITHVETIKRGIIDAATPGAQESEPLTPTQVASLGQCAKKVRETVAKLSSEHKDLHASVSKVGKAIDKNFVSDFDAMYVEGAFDGEDNQRQIDHVICEHFLRHGMLDVADCLEKDCGRELQTGQREPFLQIHFVLEALKARNLQPALQWAESNRELLLAQSLSLEFRLHKLQFIELVQQGPGSQWQAIEYAKNFASFASTRSKELQVLMGSLLYIRQGLDNSPYSHLLDPIDWEEIGDIFTRDACTLLGLSMDSPLSIVVKAGCTALPPLLTIKQVMQQRQCSSVWSAKDELPVEIDLGSDCRFHSLFACPILRQQSSDSNPPVRLVCGHVISRDALNKLANVNKWAILPNPIFHKVKCPYCPLEQSPSEAKLIYF